MTGSEFAAFISSMTGTDREERVLNAFKNGQYPKSFDGPWKKLTITDVINGTPYSLTIDVAHDFAAVGTNNDPLYISGTPKLGIKLAKMLDAYMITRKLSRIIFQASKARAPLAVPINDSKNQPRHDTGSWVESTKRVLKSLGGSRFGEGVLVGGGGKDVVLGPDLDGSRVAIYGGFGGKVDGWAWQPYSTIHDSSYEDHSHKFRFVKREAVLNGKKVDLNDDIATDKDLWRLINDHNKWFALTFPNKTSYDGYEPHSNGGGGTSGGGDTTPKPTPKPVPKPASKSSGPDGAVALLGVVGIGLAIKGLSSR